ncbi:MAG: hypothetical protein ABL865_00470, partial [Candidatus Nitrotoga sp.]
MKSPAVFSKNTGRRKSSRHFRLILWTIINWLGNFSIPLTAASEHRKHLSKEVVEYILLSGIGCNSVELLNACLRKLPDFKCPAELFMPDV